MCREENCDICPDFECVHCKNEEVIQESISFYDDPCVNCVKEVCVDCPYSDPDVFEYERDRLNCLSDLRTF